MGGSSGVYIPSGGTSSGALLRSAVSEEERALYGVKVNSFLQDLLSDFNNRDIEGINGHLETIEAALTGEGIGTVRLVYGGSIKKHTYVDGLSDVDVLARIENTSLADAPPQDILKYFASRLRERLPYTDIRVGNLAVTLVFSDGHEVQVLPALTTRTGVRIPSEDATKWSTVIRPERFAEQLTAVNQSKAAKVVPVIKLFKAINAQMGKDVKLSGYHVESLAIDAFREYAGFLNLKDMLLHLVHCSSEAVLRPTADTTGQSTHVDDYLGGSMSGSRKKVSAALGRLGVRMKAADDKASYEEWEALVGE